MTGDLSFARAAAAGVPRLFDLVRIRDARLRTAFFYALGDTVVAEHLEQASRIAYAGNRRWARVVTLQVRRTCLEGSGVSSQASVRSASDLVCRGPVDQGRRSSLAAWKICSCTNWHSL